MGKTIERITRELWDEATEWKPRGYAQPYKARGNPREVLGAFYEHLGARVLGGKVLFDRKNTADHRPDIYDIHTGVWRESKAIRMGHHPDLIIKQTKDYLTLAQDEPVDYVFTRHRVHDTGTVRATDEIFARAARSPILMLVGPSIVVRSAIETGHPYSNQYLNFGNGVYTLSSSLINGLIHEPDEWLPLIGLDQEAFSKSVLRTPRLTNLGQRVEPFVIRYLEHKDRIDEIPF